MWIKQGRKPEKGRLGTELRSPVHDGYQHRKQLAALALVVRPSPTIKRHRSTSGMSVIFARHVIQQHCRNRRRSPRHAPRQVRTNPFIFSFFLPFLSSPKAHPDPAPVPASTPPSTPSRYTPPGSTAEKSSSSRVHRAVLGARLRGSTRVRALRLPS